MAVSTGMKLIKYLLFIFNLLLVLLGLGLVIAGALVQTKFSSYFVFFGAHFNGAAILLIAIGVIVFVVAFFGCLGAYMESYCMLMTFSLLLGLIFILQIAAAIAAYVFNRKLKEIVETTMFDSIKEYDINSEVQQVWNTTQEKLKCCGATNYTDWDASEGCSASSSVPDSCCIVPETGCGHGALTNADPEKIYQTGCADIVINWAENNMAVLGGAALGVAFIQILGIILSCCLGFAIRKDYTPI